jgi:hypothetical protein
LQALTPVQWIFASSAAEAEPTGATLKNIAAAAAMAAPDTDRVATLDIDI